MNENIAIVSMDVSNAAKVCELYRTIYGEDFPFKDVYDPELLLKGSRKRGEIRVLAMEEDILLGQVMAVPASWNPELFELVGLLVAPEARQRKLGAFLVNALVDTVFPSIPWKACYTESVTGHTRSQKNDAMMGRLHTALACNMLPAAMLSHDDVFQSSGRGSCILSFTENVPPSAETLLPPRYAAHLKELAEGFRPRNFIEDDAAPAGATERDSFFFSQAATAYITVTALGEDFLRTLDPLLEEYREAASLLLRLPLVRGVGRAVEAARSRGFFLGGFLPHYFPSSDGILLQRVASTPHWEEIHVLPGRGERLVEMVRSDLEALR